MKCSADRREQGRPYGGTRVGTRRGGIEDVRQGSGGVELTVVDLSGREKLFFVQSPLAPQTRPRLLKFTAFFLTACTFQ